MSSIDDRNLSLSKGELTFGYWIATHRAAIHTAIVVFCAILAGSMAMLFIVNTVRWISNRQDTDNILTALGGPDVNYASIRKPQSITVQKTLSTIRDEKTADLLVHITNPNAIWSAPEITYQIELAGKILGPFTTNLAPKEEKFLTQQAIPFSGSTAPAVTVTILNTVWKKFADSSRLPTENWAFTNAHYGYIQTSAENAPFRTELTFTLENNSVYGFRNVAVVAQLQDTDGVIHGIGSVILDSILTNETRTLTFRWPLRLPGSITPIIHVNVNHLDEREVITAR